jgi:hypothetical protein
MNRQEFYKKYLPIAIKASEYMPAEKRLDPKLLLAVMSWESQFATNRGALQLNNVSGIKFTEWAAKLGATQSGMYANYPSLDAYAKDYARVLSNSNYYSLIHAAAKTPGFKDDVIEWNKSAYAEIDYDVNEILNRINEIDALDGVISPSQLPGGSYTLPMPNLSGKSQPEIMGLALIGALVLALVASPPKK